MINTRKRRKKGVVGRTYRFTRRHPLPVLALFLSVLCCVAIDYWLSANQQATLYIGLSVFVLTFGLYWVVKHGYGAIYVIMGWHPITGRRVCIYVGLTTQRPWIDADGVLRHPRIEQHLLGSDYYNQPPKPWADTVTDWYFAHESYWQVKPVLALLERVNIKFRRPLYNDKMNGNNSRRIDKHTALTQRAARDAQSREDITQ